jgi:hypothetical protein
MIGLLSSSLKLLIIISLTAIFSSCAVITRSTEGTTETAQNTTEASTKATGASTEFTASTSPRGEGDARAQKVKAFAGANLERLREDMARGGGEYLTAFAHLLNIPEAHRAEFFALAQQKFNILFASVPTTTEAMLTRLEMELENYPSLKE